MQARYGDRGLVVVAVNVDHERQMAEQFLRQQPGKLNVVFDPQGHLAEQFHVAAMPSSYYIDRQGKISQSHQGFRQNNRDELEQQLLALLESH